MTQELKDALKIIKCAYLDSVPCRHIDGEYHHSDEQKAMLAIAERIVREVLEELVAIQGK